MKECFVSQGSWLENCFPSQKDDLPQWKTKNWSSPKSITFYHVRLFLKWP